MPKQRLPQLADLLVARRMERTSDRVDNNWCLSAARASFDLLENLKNDLALSSLMCCEMIDVKVL